MVSTGLLTRKTTRELRRSPAQTIALVAVVALGVTAFVAAVGAYRDLDASEARTFEELRLADGWFELQPTAEGLVDEIADRPGVAAATGRLVVDTGMPIAGGDRVRARLIGADPGADALNRVLVVDGRGRQRPDEVLVERHFAERRNIRPGDTLTPLIAGRPLPLRVAGTVASPEYLQVTPDRYELLPAPSSFAVLFVDLAMLQAATDQPGLVDEVTVSVEPGAGDDVIGAVESDLRARGGLREVVRRVDQASFAALRQDLAAFRAIAFAMPTLILLAGIAAIALMLGRLVRAQRPIIGVMKAIGYSDAAVLRHYLTYALVIGVAGSVLGVIAGTGLGRVITRGYADELGVPFTTPRFHPAVAAIATAATVIAAAVAGLRPAWRSARLAPAVAVRVDVAIAGRTGRGRFERLVPLSLTGRLTARTLRRTSARTMGTVAGIVSAFVLLLMVLGLRDGIELFVQRTFDDLERWDVSATFAEPQPGTLGDGVAAWPGVTEVSPFIQLPATIAAGDRRAQILVTAIEADLRLRGLRLDAGTSATSALAPGRVVLTKGLAADLDVGPGDKVTVLAPTGRYGLEVGATSDEPIPDRAYLSLQTAARLAGGGEPPINGLYLRVEQSSVTDVRSGLYDLPGVEAVQVRDEQRDDLRSLLAIFDAIIAVMLAFAVAMAFALVFNAMTINVLEREREYGTMRAIGARPLLVARLLATEAVALWALALAPGLLVGTWVARRLGEAVAADLFVLPVRISTASYLTTAAGILAVVLLALVVPVRRIRRLDLAAATKTLA